MWDGPGARHDPGMLRNLVIPLDGSEFAARALPVGIELASTANARVRVVGIASTDAQLAWTYDHVYDDAKRAGLDLEDVEVRVDPEPVKVLLDLADTEGTALCLASHDRLPLAAKFMHAVGSELIERARHPLVVVGPNGSTEWLGRDVVVALDGVANAEPLLAVAAAWAIALQSRLRIVTVFEPVLSDLRRPEHFQRRHGPPGDPDVYLAAMRERIADVGLSGIDTVAIPDAVSIAAGLEQHLADAPAHLLVLGGGHRGVSPTRGVARKLLDNATVPLLIVNRTS
jgi:nucleotide-binding universal stress UspA family protein